MSEKIGTSQLLSILITDDLAARLDAWRLGQWDLPNRDEAVLRLIEVGLDERRLTSQTQ